ncbi:MAG: metal-dependent transcriptional regulator [Oscillospiraceae bacterium]|jgi:Mn-dependent DtxR family transcriptional regulator|nr:metal-dependent transcriptional regulator [Oscillospiraceae bacterium]
MEIHESAENYLETILMLKERQGQVRSIDIVNHLGYTKPSISVAMKRLRENGYIEMDHEGYISLTDSGMEVARRIYTRHKWLTKFLVKLGVNEKTAETDACKMEHDVSDETFRKLREHAMENLKE